MKTSNASTTTTSATFAPVSTPAPIITAAQAQAIAQAYRDRQRAENEACAAEWVRMVANDAIRTAAECGSSCARIPSRSLYGERLAMAVKMLTVSGYTVKDYHLEGCIFVSWPKPEWNIVTLDEALSVSAGTQVASDTPDTVDGPAPDTTETSDDIDPDGVDAFDDVLTCDPGVAADGSFVVGGIDIDTQFV